MSFRFRDFSTFGHFSKSQFDLSAFCTNVVSIFGLYDLSSFGFLTFRHLNIPPNVILTFWTFPTNVISTFKILVLCNFDSWSFRFSLILTFGPFCFMSFRPLDNSILFYFHLLICYLVLCFNDFKIFLNF